MSQIPFPPAILVWLYTFQGPQSSLGSQGSFTIMRFHNFFLVYKIFTYFVMSRTRLSNISLYEILNQYINIQSMYLHETKEFLVITVIST